MARGKAPAKAIPMTTLQFILFRDEMNKRTTQKKFSIRINLLLRARQGQSIKQISRDLGLAVNTVKSWRRRWQGSYEQLCAYEKGMKSQGLNEHDYL